MKKNRIYRSLFLILLVTLFALFPITSFAADKTSLPEATLPAVSGDYVSSDNIPPKDEISADPNYSEGFSMTKTSIAGGCNISKLSSSSVNTSGYTSCAPASPSVEILLSLQAYYSGAWHTLQTRDRAVSGTYVSLSQSYSVTPGYYYRAYAMHLTADGTLTTSYTNGIYVG